MAIAYPASLKAVGGAKTGIAPVNLLDVQDVNGNLYFWADRRSNAPVAIDGGVRSPAAPPVALAANEYLTWITAGKVTTNVISGVGSVAANTTSATITRTASSFGDTTGERATWSNFSLSLPPGAVIQGIYPVFLASYQGPGNNSGGLVGCTAPLPVMSDRTITEFDGQYNGGNLGSTLSGLSLDASITDSLSGPTFFQELIVSWVGLAVYYTIPSAQSAGGIYSPWLLEVPEFAFHRSLQTDTGSFIVQNLSGDSLSRDMEKTLRRSALEGALFVYRLWQPDAEAAWLEVHGTLTVEDVGVDTLPLKGSQLINPSQEDTPAYVYCETCQIDWAGKRCGSTQATECSYSFQTCQVVERIMVVMNDYEKNFGEATANTALKVINRRRRI